MNRFIGNELEHRFAAHQDTSEKGGARESKTAVDLALETCLEERSGSKATDSMDATFKEFDIK